MKFKFSLQKVLEHRRLKENLAQKDFQEELSKLYELQGYLQNMLDSVHDAHLRTGAKAQQGGAAGASLVQIHEFIKGQEVFIQRQHQKIAAQEKIVEEKRGILQQAVIETKIIDRLKEKKFEEFKKAREDEEQKEMDEQSVLRYKSPEKRESNS